MGLEAVEKALDELWERASKQRQLEENSSMAVPDRWRRAYTATRAIIDFRDVFSSIADWLETADAETWPEVADVSWQWNAYLRQIDKLGDVSGPMYVMRGQEDIEAGMREMIEAGERSTASRDERWEAKRRWDKVSSVLTWTVIHDDLFEDVTNSLRPYDGDTLDADQEAVATDFASFKERMAHLRNGLNAYPPRPASTGEGAPAPS